MKVLLILKNLAVIILCGVVAVSVWQVRGAVLKLDLTQLAATAQAATVALQAVPPVLAGLQSTERHLDDAIALTSHRMNDLCTVGKSCGTLEDVNRTLATFRGTAGQVEVGVREFNRHSAELFTQERDAYDQMETTATHVDAVISNPDIPAMIANGRKISEQGAIVATVVAGKVSRFVWYKPWTW